MKKKSFIVVVLLFAAVFFGCKKETVNEPLPLPTLTEQDRMEIWQLPTPTGPVGNLKNGADAQWSPYPYEIFIVFEDDAYFRRHLAVSGNYTCAVYGQVEKIGNQWVVVKDQARIYFGPELPEFNYVSLSTNVYGRNLPTKVTVPPQYINGKTIGNLTYEVNDPGGYGFYLLFDGTVLSAEVNDRVAVDKWDTGDPEVNLEFSIPPAPNASLVLPYNFPEYAKFEVYWEDITGYHITDIVVAPNQAPEVQINANQASDIQYVIVIPMFLNEGEWIIDWQNWGKEYIIEEISENRYGMEYYYK